MIIHEQAIWLAALAFYVFDNCILLEPTEFLLYEDAFLAWRARLDTVPFMWRSRSLYMLNPLTPFSCALKVRWICKEDGFPHARVRSVRALESSIPKMRALSTASFFTLFILGPFTTELFGLLNAITLVAPIHTSLAIASGKLLRFKGRPIRRTVTMLEYLICPGLLPNACRRYSMQLKTGEGSWKIAAKLLLDQAEYETLGRSMHQRLIDENEMNTQVASNE